MATDSANRIINVIIFTKSSKTKILYRSILDGKNLTFQLFYVSNSNDTFLISICCLANKFAFLKFALFGL